jgi:chemotaxis protein histidine kinase CheA
MNSNFHRNSFVFNQKIDSEFLYTLYEQDYGYMEKVFQMTANQLDKDIPLLEQAFREDAIDTLLRLLHKLKPTFGFVGLLKLQEVCHHLEDRYQSAVSNQTLKTDPIDLLAELLESPYIVYTELLRLSEFNKKRA